MKHVSNEQKASELSAMYETSFTQDASYFSAMRMAEWKDEQFEKEKQQWIEKACDVYCKDCEYIGCDKFECLALEKFRKAMEEQL